MSVFQRLRFPFYPQFDAADCGVACLRMVAKHYNQGSDAMLLREQALVHQGGASFEGMERAAHAIHLDTHVTEISFHGNQQEAGLRQMPLPLILHWTNDHFVVLYAISSKWAWIADPRTGKRKISIEELKSNWQQPNGRGYVMLLEPNDEFGLDEYKKSKPLASGTSISAWLQYYKKTIVQIGFGLLVLLLLSLMLPLLTQSLVDWGIENRDVQLILVLLIGQLVLFGSQVVVQLMQAWALLHLGLRIQIGLLNDFLSHTLRLPHSFLQRYSLGDLLQRIEDHERIEVFLTNHSAQMLLGAAQLLVFGGLMLFFRPILFFIFLIGSLIIAVWIAAFAGRRKEVDYRRFREMTKHQNKVVELLKGATDIKLMNNAQHHKTQWYGIQKSLFQAQLDVLRVGQWQDGGALAIHQLKDIAITFVAARAVVMGEMTFGGLLAIQFMLGQMNAPIHQLSNFMRGWQDAQLGWQRINQMRQQRTEQSGKSKLQSAAPSIRFDKVSFRYSPEHPWILKSFNAHFPKGKTTAIVGESGIGKSTVLKLILGLLEPVEGQIFINDLPLQALDKTAYRQMVGAVLQDAFLFEDSVVNNIAGSDQSDENRLREVLSTVELRDFIAHLPKGIDTKIETDASGWSAGQRQRLLLARALYPAPKLLVLDEALNALDAQTESIIQKSLFGSRSARTTILVAHRLNTIQHADYIVYMEGGGVAENGTFEDLLRQRGRFYSLVKSQIRHPFSS